MIDTCGLKPMPCILLFEADDWCREVLKKFDKSWMALIWCNWKAQGIESLWTMHDHDWRVVIYGTKNGYPGNREWALQFNVFSVLTLSYFHSKSLLFASAYSIFCRNSPSLYCFSRNFNKSIHLKFTVLFIFDFKRYIIRDMEVLGWHIKKITQMKGSVKGNLCSWS